MIVPEGPLLPTPALRITAMLLGLSGLPGTPAELPADGEVARATLAAHLEPDPASVAPERLRKGDRVRVVDADPGSGWLTIEPPGSAFEWVERSSVRKVSVGVGRVIAPETVARAGIAGARMPGPPRSVLVRGATVRLLDRPGLVVGTGRKATTWLAVAPRPGEVRYVRADGLVARRPGQTPEPPRETRVAFEEARSPGSGTALPPEVAAIESEHRAALDQPIERWQFGQIKSRYERLLERSPDPATADAVRARLAVVARHEEIARSARAFRALLERSRRRDQEVALTLHRLAELDQPGRRPFVAEGLIQPSSRLVDGHRVYALIGANGEPIAYLDVPPGLDARPALAKRVGVRGSVRYNESLGSRLIAVKDLEPLE